MPCLHSSLPPSASVRPLCPTTASASLIQPAIVVHGKISAESRSRRSQSSSNDLQASNLHHIGEKYSNCQVGKFDLIRSRGSENKKDSEIIASFFAADFVLAVQAPNRSKKLLAHVFEEKLNS